MLTPDFTADIEAACGVLRSGGVILYPTDTIWGLGCDATSERAVSRIFEIKQRPEHKALLALVADGSMLSDIVGSGMAGRGTALAERTGRPTTIIYPDSQGLAQNMTGDGGSVGIRITSEDFSNALCRAFGRPIVSTSANISGSPAPRYFDDIAPQIVNAADYVCQSRRHDHVACEPSAIMQISPDGTVTRIR